MPTYASNKSAAQTWAQQQPANSRGSQLWSMDSWTPAQEAEFNQVWTQATTPAPTPVTAPVAAPVPAATTAPAPAPVQVAPPSTTSPASAGLDTLNSPQAVAPTTLAGPSPTGAPSAPAAPITYTLLDKPSRPVPAPWTTPNAFPQAYRGSDGKEYISPTQSGDEQDAGAPKQYIPIDEYLSSPLYGSGRQYTGSSNGTLESILSKGPYIAAAAVGGAAALGAGAAGGAAEGGLLSGGLGSDALLGSAAGDTLGGSAALGLDPLTLGETAGYGGGVSGAGSGIAGAANPPGLLGGLLDGLPNLPPGSTTAAQQLLNGGSNESSGLPGDPGNVNAQGGSANVPVNGTGTTSAAATSALGRLLNGTGTPADWAQVLGGVGSTALGYLGAQDQTNAYRDVANQYLGLGAPYRDKLNASYAPGFDLASDPVYEKAFGRAADISARKWSAEAGNPAGSPTAQAGILSDVWNGSALPALSNYRGQLGQFGGLGLNTSGAASLTGAQSQGGTYDALGYGLSQLTQPQNSIQDLLKQIGGGQNQLKLNLGNFLT